VRGEDKVVVGFVGRGRHKIQSYGASEGERSGDKMTYYTAELHADGAHKEGPTHK